MNREGTVKEWYEIQSDFDSLENMSCKPIGITKVSANHVFDENKSIKWNKKQVEINNDRYQKEVARLNTEKNKFRDNLMEDIYKRIQHDLGHNISRKSAMKVWNCAYEIGNSWGIHSVMEILYDLIELISGISQEKIK